MEMTQEEDKFEWPSVEELYRPPKEEWEHDPNAETVPWWIMPLIILMILGFAIILVHAQQLQTLFTN